MKLNKTALVAIPLVAFGLGFGLRTLLAPGPKGERVQNADRGAGKKGAANATRPANADGSKEVAAPGDLSDVKVGSVSIVLGSRTLGVPAGTRVRLVPRSEKNPELAAFLLEWAETAPDGAGPAYSAEGVEVGSDGKLEIAAPVLPPLALMIWNTENAFAAGSREVGKILPKRATKVAVDLGQIGAPGPAPAEGAGDEATEARTAERPAKERSGLGALDPNATADFYALVVTAGDEPKPVVGAKARLNGETLATSDALGRFALKYEPGVAPLVRVTGPGLGPTLVQVRPGHESGETALLVRLRPSAAIASRIIGSDGKPVRGLTVEVSTDMSALAGEEAGFAADRSDVPATLGTIMWAGSSNELGAVYLEGLPGDVPLSIRAFRSTNRAGDAAAARIDGIPRQVTLAPGEKWSGEWRIPARPELHGRVVDQMEEPVAGVPIWLVKPESSGATGSRFLRREDHPVATCETDESGTFLFESVEPGLWLVGVGLQPAGSELPWQLDLDHLAQAIEVSELGGPAPPEMLLRVGRGLSLRGVVLQAGGGAAAGVLVTALEDGGRGVADARTAADGTFAIAPVSKGAYRLIVASHSGSGMQSFGPIAAGSRDLVLQLADARPFVGRVVSTDGAPRAASIAVFQEGAQRAQLRTQEPERPGVFEALALEAGLYDFVATTEDGEVGIARDVVVGPAQAEGALRVSLARGGLLNVRWDGERKWRPFTVFADERAVALGILRRGVSRPIFVPAGRVSVRLPGAPDAEPLERSVEVPADGQAELVLGSAAPASLEGGAEATPAAAALERAGGAGS